MSSCPCSSAENSAGKNTNPLEGALKAFIKSLGRPEKMDEEEIARAWKTAAGEDAAKHSKPVSFKKGSLAVNIDRSSWLYELTVRKKEILGRLSENLKGQKIREIRFRIGDIK